MPCPLPVTSSGYMAPPGVYPSQTQILAMPNSLNNLRKPAKNGLKTPVSASPDKGFDGFGALGNAHRILEFDTMQSQINCAWHIVKKAG